MAPWPSGKAKVCKTSIPRFKSGWRLQKIPDFLSGILFYIYKFVIWGILMLEIKELDQKQWKNYELVFSYDTNG